MNKKIEETSIIELGLSKRTTYILIENGIDKVSDLIAKDNNELKKIRGIGKKTIEEISIAKQELEKRIKAREEKLKRQDREKNNLPKQENNLEKLSIEELEALQRKNAKELSNIISEIKEQDEKIRILDEKIAKIRGKQEEQEDKGEDEER